VTDLAAQTIGSVTSADGTRIGYRRFGKGPGLVLVHGSMMASQNFTRLAAALADTFTIVVPDRRGRGMSGPFGADYGVASEVEDLRALLDATGSQDAFGLSSGALIVLESARQLPGLRRVALYEPPLSFVDSRSTDWVPRYDREMGAGHIASAFVTIAKGTTDPGPMQWLPRFVLVPALRLALLASGRETPDGDVAIADLIPTAHYDARLVLELADSLDRYRSVPVPVLLLRGARSRRYLQVACDRLAGVLPDVRSVEFPMVGHLAADNDGKPELVATELRDFFSSPSAA